MMNMNQIVETLNCGRQTALTMLRKAGVEPVRAITRNGRKHFYDITPERLLEIGAQLRKDQEQTTAMQSAALTALESVFNRVARENRW